MVPLSIVIPTYNGRNHLERCLPSVCRFAPPATQVLVVDDGSTDDTLSWVGRYFPQVELVVLDRNQGYCAAVNRGIEKAQGRIIELLNNDTEVCAGWAEACLDMFADPRVGSVAPLVLRMDQPGIIDSAGVSYHICGWAYNRGYGVGLDEKRLPASEVFGASGSAGFFRHSALQQVGGLRPEFDAYLEDVDLAFRLRWAGYRSLFQPAARVYHRGHATYGTAGDNMARLVSRNEDFVFWMNLPLSRLLLGLAPYLGFQLLRIVRKGLNGKLLAHLSGKFQALAGWRKIVQRRRELTARDADLRLSCNIGILKQGINWLRRRQCA